MSLQTACAPIGRVNFVMKYMGADSPRFFPTCKFALDSAVAGFGVMDQSV